ncbi:MAG: DNA primase [Rhodoluna sp.]|nr:DNA primase [Rhodoluna sp.]
MAGRIRARDIEEVKSRVNIADVVSDYLALKPAGVGSLKGLCPFHDEKSPSFTVKPNDGFYKCFGCGEGGDVYKFLQQLDHISFYEAVEKLAARVGFVLTYEEGAGPSPDHGLKNRILEANNATALFYQSQLMSDGAETGRDFLMSRGFDKTAAERFSIGFAPKAWAELFNHLKSLGFSDDELISAALVTKGDKGIYDKFRGRLIWPIKDATSQVIGFGARKLFDDDTGPKYLNSSDTLVYHKSQVLYGIDLAKRDISKQQQVVVVEGYTDVMACHLAGVTTAVATCGTAFGDDHIRTLNRMLSSSVDSAAEVIFTFDPDAAGQKAAMRAYNDSNKFNAQTFVAVGPDGLDPCDLRSEKGDEAVVAMIANKRPMFEFAIKQKISKFDLNTLEGRVAAARAAAPVVAQIRDAALRPAYIRELAGWVSLEGNEVAALVDVALKQARSESVSPMRRDVIAEGEAPPAEQVDSSQYPTINLGDPIMRFERQLLEVIVQVPAAVEPALALRICKSAFSAPSHIAVANAIEASVALLGKHEFLPNLSVSLPPELHSVLFEIAGQPLPARNETELLVYAQGVLARGISAILAREKTELLAALRREDPASEQHKQIGIQLQQLESERRTLGES